MTERQLPVLEVGGQTGRGYFECEWNEKHKIVQKALGMLSHNSSFHWN